MLKKMWVAFVAHIFSAKNNKILCIESAKTVNELVKLTTLWTTEPCLFNFSKIFTILLWNTINSNLSKKSKNYFLRQNFQNINLLQKLHRSKFKMLSAEIFNQQAISNTQNSIIMYYFLQNKDVSEGLNHYHSMGKFSRRQTDDIFLIFLENKIWHFMQIIF